MFRSISCMFTLLLGMAYVTYGTVIIERWGIAGGKNQHPTLSYTTISKALSVDLAPLSSASVVYRATLYTSMNVWNGWDGAAPHGRTAYALDSVLIYNKTGAGASDYSSVPLQLLPPYYRSFDMTDAVRGWLSSSGSNYGLYVKQFPNFDASKSYLEIMYEGDAGSPPAQITGLHAFYRAGQTFITWNEMQDWVGKDNPTTLEMYDIMANRDSISPQEVRYYVFQHTSPITASNIKDATFLESIRPVSIWNLMDITNDWQCEQCQNGLLATYVLERFSTDEDGNGTRLPRDKGLYVHAVTSNQNSYYAVVTVVNGKANTIDLSAENVVGPINETISMTEPTFQGLDTVSYGGEVEHFIHFLSPPFANIPGPGLSWDFQTRARQFNDGWHYVNLRTKVINRGGALTLECASWGGVRSNSVTGFGQPINNGIKIRTNDQWPPNGFTGLHECLGTFRSWRDGKVHNYAARRIISYVGWADRRWGIDSNQIYMTDYEGMWSVRYPQVFAAHYIKGLTDAGQVNPSFTWQLGSRLDRVWGQEAWGVSMADTMINAWDWFDYSKAYYTDSIHMSPLVSQPGPSHDWKGRGDRAWGGEPRMVENTQKYKQAFVFSWRCSNCGLDAGWVGLNQSPTCCSNYQGLRHSSPFMAFTNNTLDQDIGDTMWHNDTIGYGGDGSGQINGFAYFDSIRETSTSFSVNLFLNAPYLSDFACTPTVKRNCGLTLDTGAHVDATPRRMQQFEVNACDTFTWNIVYNSATVDSGEIVASNKNVVTVPGVFITKEKRKLTLLLKGRSDGVCTINAAVEKTEQASEDIVLRAFPVPFNPSTRIYYTVPPHSSVQWGGVKEKRVRIAVYDVKGTLVRVLADGVRNRGGYTVDWNGVDRDNRQVSTGMYVVRMSAGKTGKMIKVLLVK